MKRFLESILYTDKNVYYRFIFTIILACAAIILSYYVGFIFGKIFFQLKTNII